MLSYFSLSLRHRVGLLLRVDCVQLVGHLMGCAWYFMAEDRGLGSGTWADDFHMEDKDRASRYLMSVYWAFVTVTTVGYGDVTPVNDAERVYVKAAVPCLSIATARARACVCVCVCVTFADHIHACRQLRYHVYICGQRDLCLHDRACYSARESDECIPSAFCREARLSGAYAWGFA